MPFNVASRVMSFAGREPAARFALLLRPDPPPVAGQREGLQLLRNAPRQTREAATTLRICRAGRVPLPEESGCQQAIASQRTMHREVLPRPPLPKRKEARSFHC